MHIVVGNDYSLQYALKRKAWFNQFYALVRRRICDYGRDCYH